MKFLKLTLIALLVLTGAGSVFSQSTFEKFEDSCFIYETLSKSDSGILVSRHIFEISSIFNARIVIRTTFIDRSTIDKHGVRDSTLLSSVPDVLNTFSYVPTQLKYIEGEPAMKGDELYFKSDDGKNNKNFFLIHKDDNKSNDIEALKELGEVWIWAKSKCPEPEISIGF